MKQSSGEVVAVKMPFTDRTETLEMHRIVRNMDAKLKADQFLAPMFGETRLVVAELRTPNLLNMARSR